MSAIAASWVASITVGNQTAKQLLQFYASHNFGKPGFEFKNSTLANQLEVSERAIRSAHKLLLEKKFILKEERYSPSGRQLTNSFYLNIPQSFIDKFLGEGELRSSLGGNYVPGEGEVRSSLINNKYINNKINKIKSSCASNDAQASFEKFWVVYPRKVNKIAAQRIWVKQKLYEHSDTIISDLVKRKSTEWCEKDMQFIPHPSTYLNGQRWNDEITPNNKFGAKTHENFKQSHNTTIWNATKELHIKACRENGNADSSGKEGTSSNNTRQLDYNPFSTV